MAYDYEYSILRIFDIKDFSWSIHKECVGQVCIKSSRLEAIDKVKKNKPKVMRKLIESYFGKHVKYLSYKIMHSTKQEIQYAYEERTCKQCGTSYKWIDELVLRGAIYHKDFGRIEVCYSCSIDKRFKLLHNAITYGFNQNNTTYTYGLNCIYFIYNRQTNEGYVGQTIRNVAWRWYEHIQQWIIDKWGVKLDGISFEVLESWDAKEKISINEREVFWIHKKMDEGITMINKVLFNEKLKAKEKAKDDIFNQLFPEYHGQVSEKIGEDVWNHID